MTFRPDGSFLMNKFSTIVRYVFQQEALLNPEVMELAEGRALKKLHPYLWPLCILVGKSNCLHVKKSQRLRDIIIKTFASRK